MKKFLLLLICVIPGSYLSETRNCKITAPYTMLPTFFLRNYYINEARRHFFEPELPIDTTLRDRLFGDLKCGNPVVDVTKTIVNGQDAPAKAWPWQALLVIKDKSSICGGTLISKSWVLTAAHCIGDNITVLLGDRTRANSQLFTPKKIIPHEGYHWGSSHDDVALIKLDRAAVFNDYVKPACLPRYGASQPSDEHCYATGYGSSGFTATTGPDKLQQIKVFIMPQSMCAYTYKLFHGTFSLDRRSLCMDLNEYNQTGCFGDSGGPLSCKRDGRFEVVGTLTYSFNNCTSKTSSIVLMRVSEYLDWIVTNVEKIGL